MSDYTDPELLKPVQHNSGLTPPKIYYYNNMSLVILPSNAAKISDHHNHLPVDAFCMARIPGANAVIH